jgi:hypothetical protein
LKKTKKLAVKCRTKNKNKNKKMKEEEKTWEKPSLLLRGTYKEKKKERKKKKMKSCVLNEQIKQRRFFFTQG